jgi:hypothetical protein
MSSVLRIPSIFLGESALTTNTKQSQSTIRLKLTCIGIDLYTHDHILSTANAANIYFQVNPRHVSEQERCALYQNAISTHLTQPNLAHIPHFEQCCHEYEFDYLGPVWSCNPESDEEGHWNWLYHHVASDILVVRESDKGSKLSFEEKRRIENEHIHSKQSLRDRNTLIHGIHECPILSILELKRPYESNQILLRKMLAWRSLQCTKTVQ